jgi:hypothetical protein
VHDVLIEEWITYRNELPADVKGDTNGIVRTVNGDLPQFTGRSLNAAVFADSYSRLWDPRALLKRLNQSLHAGGYVAIVDRQGPENEPRHLAGHHRRIHPALVKADLEQNGFEFVKELKAPAKDRFFLLFRARGS